MCPGGADVLMSPDPVGNMFNVISNLGNANLLAFRSSKCRIEAVLSDKPRINVRED
jgi:hypothetical protein